MPVTARLSRRFYEALGDEIANELVDWFNAVDLTYRDQLREFNDLNWSRVDTQFRSYSGELRALEARMGQRFDEMRQEIVVLEARMEQRLNGLRQEMVALEARTNARMDVRFDELKGEMAALESRVDARMDRLQSLLGRQLAEARADLVKWMFVFWAGSMLTMIGLMVTVIRLR